jgi:glycosyltransferase involved in cell wall biosynthesis
MAERKIKVALICQNNIFAGGATTYESNIIRYLLNENQENLEFIIFQAKGYASQNDIGRVSSYRNGIIRQFGAFLRSTIFGLEILRYTGFRLGQLERLLIKSNVDIAYFLSPNPLALGILDLPMVNTVWDLGHRDLPEFNELAGDGRFKKREHFYANTLGRSSLVVTDSEKTCGRLIEVYDLDSKRVLSAGLFPSVEDASPSVDINFEFESDPFFLYPAQFWPHKNHKLLIEFMKIFCISNPSYKLIFTGSDKGNLPEIKDEIVNANLQNNIIILGFVENELLTKLMISAVGVLFVSRLGPTNLPPLEALSLGTPVVVTHSNCNLLHDPKNGVWVIEDNTISSLIDAVNELISIEKPKLRWSFHEANQTSAKGIITSIANFV